MSVATEHEAPAAVPSSAASVAEASTTAADTSASAAINTAPTSTTTNTPATGSGWGSWTALASAEQKLNALASSMLQTDEDKENVSESSSAVQHEKPTAAAAAPTTPSIESAQTTDSIEDDVNELVENIGSAFRTGAGAFSSWWSKSVTTLQENAPVLQQQLAGKLSHAKKNLQQAATTANIKMHALAQQLDLTLDDRHAAMLRKIHSDRLATHGESTPQTAFEEAFVAAGGNETVQALQFVGQSCKFTVNRNLGKLSAADRTKVNEIFADIQSTLTPALPSSISATDAHTDCAATSTSTSFGVFESVHQTISERLHEKADRVASAYASYTATSTTEADNKLSEYTSHDQAASAIIDLFTNFLEATAHIVADLLQQVNTILNELIEPSNTDVPKSAAARTLYTKQVAADCRSFIDSISQSIQAFSRTTHKHVQLILSTLPTTEGSSSFTQLMNITEQLTTDLHDSTLISAKKLQIVVDTLVPVLQLVITDSPAAAPVAEPSPTAEAAQPLSSTVSTTASKPSLTVRKDAALSIDGAESDSSIPTTPVTSAAPNAADIMNSMNKMVSPLQDSDLFSVLNTSSELPGSARK